MSDSWNYCRRQDKERVLNQSDRSSKRDVTQEMDGLRDLGRETSLFLRAVMSHPRRKASRTCMRQN